MQSPNHIPPTQGSDEHVRAWVLSNRDNDQMVYIARIKRLMYTYGQWVLTEVNGLRSV